MVLLAAFLTQIGALETAPVLIAVFTAFLTMEGVKYLLVSRRQARAAEAKTTAGAEPAAPG
jgi:chloride channel protein, CIC family